MRLGDYYERHYKGYMRYLAPGTAQGYDGDWRNHIAGEFAAWEMEDIRVRHINAWLASDHFAGSHLFYKLARAVNGCLRVVRVQPLLELGGSVCP